MALAPVCRGCGAPLVIAATGRLSKRYCNARCKMRYFRQQALRQETPVPDAPMPWEQPVLHHGCFEDYADAYAGQIDVLLTDPPYDRKALPVYSALAAFAATALRPGGWLLCLTGKGLLPEIFPLFSASALEYLTLIDYRMSASRSRAGKWTSTGRRHWQERAKPVLWYQRPVPRQPGQRGQHPMHRRVGGIDFVDDCVEGRTDLDQGRYPDQQSLAGFEQLVSKYTTPQDVILDPCMGWGTTLHAALRQLRPHVIGIEKNGVRYQHVAAHLPQWRSSAA